MMIILEGPEAVAYINKLAREAALEVTSRLPEGFGISNGPAARKKEIMKLAATGMFPSEIASRLGLKFNSVRDLIYRERKKAKIDYSPLFADVQFRYTPPVEIQEKINKRLIATSEPVQTENIGDVGESAKDEATPIPEPILKGEPSAQDRIDNIIMAGSKKGYSHTQIAAKIGYIVGGNYISSDVSRRLKELREGGKP